MASKRKKISVSSRYGRPSYPKGITKNGVRIYDAMKFSKTKGNWKDYVLFVGDQMIDRYGTYTITRMNSEGEKVKTDNNIMLVHKAKLKSILGEKFGSKFWDHKRRKRLNVGEPPLKKKEES